MICNKCGKEYSILKEDSYIINWQINDYKEVSLWFCCTNCLRKFIN